MAERELGRLLHTSHTQGTLIRTNTALFVGQNCSNDSFGQQRCHFSQLSQGQLNYLCTYSGTSLYWTLWDLKNSLLYRSFHYSEIILHAQQSIWSHKAVCYREVFTIRGVCYKRFQCIRLSTHRYSIPQYLCSTFAILMPMVQDVYIYIYIYSYLKICQRISVCVQRFNTYSILACCSI